LATEKTGEQILVTTGVDGRLAKALPSQWNKKVRLMRNDPTIGFVRDLYAAPMLATEWTVTSEHPEFKDAEPFIMSQITKTRRDTVRSIIRGLLDFGWQSFETVWGYAAESDKIELVKLKPLLQDITDILVTYHGEICGVRNLPMYLSNLNQRVGPWVDLNLDECAVFFRDVEGTNWYGQPLMRRVEKPYDAWEECDKAARRFDTKIAGAHWVIHYPPGTSKIDGENKSNYLIAKEMLGSLESSGKIVVPREIAKWVEDMTDMSEDKMAWKIELISVSGSSESSFVGRQKYLDALKARGIGIPERAVFEGQFGTKAEAEAHADFAIDNIEMGHLDIVDRYNVEIVDFLLEVNYGPRYVGKVKVRATPLSDVKRAQLRALYMQILGSSDGAAEELDAIDIPAIRDELNIPTRK